MEKIFAQTLKFTDGKGFTVTGKLKWTTFGDVINALMPYLFAIAGFGILLMLVFAGFSFLTSAGDPKKMESAKQRITNALIGFLLIFGAYWVVQIAGYMFGIKNINDVFK